MRPARRIGRNATVLIAGDIAAKVASLAFFAVMARFLGQQGFGDFTFALALGVVLVTIAGFGLDSLVTRGVARDREQLHRVLWNAIGAKLLLGTGAVVLATAVAILGDYGGGIVVTVAILAIATLVESIGKTIGAVFQGIEDMAPIAISSIVQRFSTAVAAIVAMVVGASLQQVAVLYLFGASLGLLYAVIALARRDVRPRLELSTRSARALLVASIPLGVGVVFTTILWRIDSTILSLLKGNAAVGLYGAAYRLLDSTLFISFFFVGALFPALSRLRRDTAPTVARAYEVGSKALAVTLLPLGAAFVAFADPIVETVYGSSFQPSAPALRLLGGAAVLYGLCYLGIFVLISQDRQRVVPWIVGAVTVQNVILNLILIPSYSYQGAAAATTISEATLALLTVFCAVRVTGRISLSRIVLGPALGCVGIGLTALVLGANLAGMIGAAIAYLLILVVVEWFLYPNDVRLAVRALFGDRQLRVHQGAPPDSVL